MWAVIDEAAVLEGESVSEFVVAAGLTRAFTVIAEHDPGRLVSLAELYAATRAFLESVEVAEGGAAEEGG